MDNDINVDEAKWLSWNSHENEIEWILNEIRKKANSNEKYNKALQVKRDLKKDTIDELKNRGFIVNDWAGYPGPNKCVIIW